MTGGLRRPRERHQGEQMTDRGQRDKQHAHVGKST